MRKLVIGCGYLGRRVAAAWRAGGDDVVALTRSEENAEQLRTTGITPVIGDVLQPETLAKLPDADTVLYAVGFDRQSGRSQREVSVSGLENVLRVLAPKIGRFLYISSTSVYGQSHGEWVDEETVCQPTQPNGHVVLDAERIVWTHFPPDAPATVAGREAPRANILRLAGIYGPGRLLQRIESLKSGTPLTVDPEGWLNLIHVDDAAAAVQACEQRGTPGKTYLVCDDEPLRRRDYYTHLAELVNAPPPTFDPQPGAGRTIGLNKRCSNRRLRESLGVSLQFPTYREGLPHALGLESRL